MAKPSAVFQDTDSICPPTRRVATASAPNADTILVISMEIIQYTIPWIPVGIPILQIPLRYFPDILPIRRIPFSTFSFFCQMMSSTIILITMNWAVTVAIAAPLTPSFGNGPGPRISRGSRIIFVTSPTRLARKGVLESPCAV